MFTDRISLNNNKIRFNIPRITLQQGTYNINLFSTVDEDVADWVQNVAKIQIEPYDYYHTGERETVDEINNILKINNTAFSSKDYSSLKTHTLICSKNLYFLTSL